MAPDKMIGAHVSDTYLVSQPNKWAGPDVSLEDRIWAASFGLNFPLASTLPVTFTRPIYSYPLYAKYKATGDPDNAASFIPAKSTLVTGSGQPSNDRR